MAWAEWVARTFTGLEAEGERLLSDWTARHVALAEAIATGRTPSDDHLLWKQAAGEKALAVMRDLATHAEHGGAMSAADHADLLGALLSGAEVREADAPHPDVMIWG